VAVIDLNADLGEGAGSDAELMVLVTSASVACGGHAGDARSMAETAALAGACGVVVGAHPSYPDREGFGRRRMDLAPTALAASLRRQVAALAALSPVGYLKPHGALYNDAAVDATRAAVVADVAAELGLPLLVLPGSALAAAGEAAGVAVFAEGFADRAYHPDGRLVSRDQPGGLLTDPPRVAERAVSLATAGGVEAADGTWLDLPCRSICLHGDTPGALSLARSVRRALEAAGVTLAPFAR
jgi:UPF0271 protein